MPLILGSEPGESRERNLERTRGKTDTESEQREPGVVMVSHTFNLSAQDAEAGRSLWVQGQFDLQSEFQDTEKLCLENK